MDSSLKGQNRQSERERQDIYAKIKSTCGSPKTLEKSREHLTSVNSFDAEGRYRQGCTIIFSELSLRHLAETFLLLPFSFGFSLGAIMVLAFGALGLCPISVAAGLFLKLAGANALALAWLIGRSRRR